jgi:hypothetical protein
LLLGDIILVFVHPIKISKFLYNASKGELVHEHINIIGEHFGKLTVVSWDEATRATRHPRVVCQCECNRITTVQPYDLKRGKSKSCGICQYEKDLTGQRFGKLVALKLVEGRPELKTHKAWLCQCDCNNLVKVQISVLIAGKKKSCGCIMHQHPSDLTGHHFGKLTVLSLSEQKNKAGGNIWNCQCSCGNLIAVGTGTLNSGNTRSCGCLKNEVAFNSRLPPGVTGYRRLLLGYKNKAKDRSLLFDLDDKTFELLTQSDCFYCGDKPSQESKNPGYAPYIYNGIDRIDNQKGYVLGNVVPCCKHCNRGKMQKTVDEFAQQIENIYWYWASKTTSNTIQKES